MRLLAISLLVAGLAIYSLRDWFKSLCGLIVLMAVLEHEDMPKSIMGIVGLNPWNLLMAVILVAWLIARGREGLRWDMPAGVTALLLAGLGIVIAGWVRMYLDPSHLESYSTMSMISEELINTVKWVIPALLVYDGCRDRRRLRWAMGALLGMTLLLGVQVVRRLPPAAALGGQEENIQRLRMKACLSIGYSSVEMSVLLAGACWAFAAAALAAQTHRQRLLLAIGALVLTYATALTGGRAGYVAWGAAGLAMCCVRWRKALLLAPVMPLLLVAAFPGAAQRMTYGIGGTDPAGEATVDQSKLSSGRLMVWPYVIQQIGESPLIGHGRFAMERTGLQARLLADLGRYEAFPHPHSMYLEWLLDNGIVGMVPAAMLLGWVLVQAGSLFGDRRDRLFAAAGGVAFALVLAQAVGGLTSQHLYPNEATVPMWTAILLTVRLYVERRKALHGWVAPVVVSPTARGLAAVPAV